ncbi:Uncharacterized protein PECH_005338 [Penicillium ucsense]|uniref:FAD-binding FR-type domain-containing protein n=1 Tax=Penicillium ucsense TaxID=2839758 RepID=A0A8J8VVC7_9EURO|nr:Uncharacterized protein PECM_005018 [Penicillium ucsense]KAF7722388.1 Uncharacterized protein PECH_005338 [Penicillium ucsense]
MSVTALQSWHPGEVAIQRRLGFADAVKHDWARVINLMPTQHQIFFSSNIQFLPLTTIDKDGRPWGSIASGPNGDIGFIQSPSAHSLSIHVKSWAGDPLLKTLNELTSQKCSRLAVSETQLTAGLGIEFTTRRRNKLAGFIADAEALGDLEYRVELTVTQALGNCPKYINVRNLVSYPESRAKVLFDKPSLSALERLPDKVIEFIQSADTVFMASIFKPTPTIAQRYPAHAGMNARSGLPGFVRVRPSDDRTVVIPDYSGNRFVSSLGNIEATGLAGLTVVSFDTGDILYLTGEAKNHVGADALKIMTRHASLTTLTVTGYTFVRDALPVRQKQGSSVERSPYDPKVKYLVEEEEAENIGSGSAKAHVQEAVRLSPDLAIFKFKISSGSSSSPGMKIKPGQSVVLDFMDWIGPPEYRHMADAAPGSINDDRVRTWTVSSAHEGQDLSWFEITMRKMPGGVVTGNLFDLLENSRIDTRNGDTVKFDGSVHAELVGVTGDFILGPSESLDALWVAGGIGVTPFLAMLHALEQRHSTSQGDVWLVLSTREPDLMLKLIFPSLKKIAPKINFSLHVFTSVSNLDSRVKMELTNFNIEIHRGRVGSAFWDTVPKTKDVFICGPNAFGNAAESELQSAGIQPSQIHREGFY